MLTVLGGVHGYDFNLRGWDDKWERVWIKSHGIFWFSHHKCWDLWMSVFDLSPNTQWHPAWCSKSGNQATSRSNDVAGWAVLVATNSCTCKILLGTGDLKSKNVAKKMNQGFIMFHCQFHVGISLRCTVCSPNWLGDPDVGMLKMGATDKFPDMIFFGRKTSQSFGHQDTFKNRTCWLHHVLVNQSPLFKVYQSLCHRGDGSNRLVRLLLYHILWIDQHRFMPAILVFTRVPGFWLIAI